MSLRVIGGLNQRCVWPHGRPWRLCDSRKRGQPLARGLAAEQQHCSCAATSSLAATSNRRFSINGQVVQQATELAAEEPALAHRFIRLAAQRIGVRDRDPEEMPGATKPVICRHPSGSNLNSLARPAMMLKKVSAGSPSSIKHCPAATSVTIAMEASLARSASPMALHTLTDLASRVAQGPNALRQSSRFGGVGR